MRIDMMRYAARLRRLGLLCLGSLAAMPLGAGTIIGSGTVSNYDRSAGSSCLAERCMLEIIEHGEAKTPFLKFGDRVRIEMFDAAGQSIFGAIDQVVERYEH